MSGYPPPLGARTSKRVVLIYTNDLLPRSCTFIRAQAEALRVFEPHYVGSRLCDGLALPKERTHMVHRGGRLGNLQDVICKIAGLVPSPAAQLARLRPVLVHAHFGPDAIQAMFLARNLRVPLVVTFHGYDATTRDDWARRSFFRHRVYVARRDALKRSASLFLAVSQFIRDRLLEQGFPAERTIVHYTGVDNELFHGDPDGDRESLVLFAGNLIPQKGVSHLLRAMALLSARHPAFRTVVLGDGPELASLRRLAAQLQLQAEFLGVRPPDEVAAWLRRAAVFCAPSVTAGSGAREGFGMVFAEAQACGVPVVSYRVGGIPEAVGDGSGGLLVREGDYHGLACALDRLIESKQLRVSLGRAGQKRTSLLFNLRRQTVRLEALYERVLQAPTATDSGLVGPLVR